MKLVVMSKRFGQISYFIPEDTKDLCVAIDYEMPSIIRNFDEVIEPLISVRVGDFLEYIDPSKKI